MRVAARTRGSPLRVGLPKIALPATGIDAPARQHPQVVASMPPRFRCGRGSRQSEEVAHAPEIVQAVRDERWTPNPGVTTSRGRNPHRSQFLRAPTESKGSAPRRPCAALWYTRWYVRWGSTPGARPAWSRRGDEVVMSGRLLDHSALEGRVALANRADHAGPIVMSARNAVHDASEGGLPRRLDRREYCPDREFADDGGRDLITG